MALQMDANFLVLFGSEDMGVTIARNVSGGVRVRTRSSGTKNNQRWRFSPPVVKIRSQGGGALSPCFVFLPLLRFAAAGRRLRIELRSFDGDPVFFFISCPMVAACRTSQARAIISIATQLPHIRCRRKIGPQSLDAKIFPSPESLVEVVLRIASIAESAMLSGSTISSLILGRSSALYLRPR